MNRVANNYKKKLEISKIDRDGLAENKDHDFWERLLENIQKLFGESVFKSWFQYFEFSNIENGCLTCFVRNSFEKEWINTNYLDKIRQLAAAIDSNIYKVDLRINKGKKEAVKNKKEPNNSQEVIVKYTEKLSNKFQIESLLLDNKYHFDNFQLGEENRLAYSIFHSKAEDANEIIDSSSNPLALYAGVGQGKTHLITSAISKIVKNTNKKVLFLSSERFIYHYILAVRSNKLIEFKTFFKDIEILAIDDLQFLCGKGGTEEEFLNIFNYMLDNNKQVILSSDCNPRDLKFRNPRLRSRLTAGISIKIKDMGYSLGKKILDHKLEQVHLTEEYVNNDLREKIIQDLVKDGRAIEGIVNKIKLFKDAGVEANNLLEMLEEDIGYNSNKIISLEGIMEVILNTFNIKRAELESKSRLQKIVLCRKLFCYLADKLTDKSLAEIGRFCGNRTHSAVLYLFKSLKKDIEKDKIILTILDDLENKIRRS